MILYINSNSVLVSTEEMEKSPLLIFQAYYTQTDLPLLTTFSEWLNRYIIPTIYINTSPETIKNKIKEVLSDNDSIAVATLRLFPNQIEMTEENWEHIKTVITRILQYNRPNKKVKDLQYKDMLEYFESHRGDLINAK